jgi:hypothetical protein
MRKMIAIIMIAVLIITGIPFAFVGAATEIYFTDSESIIYKFYET